MASNFDGLGASNSVLRKISSESHQCDRLHKDMFESLLRFQESLEKSNASKKYVKCFIQSISVDPIIIHYQTENGVRLWHELVATKVVFLDATGSVNDR